ncbi:hypothetical protein [Branchiibius sp. NY16-3462-2]|uniref:hypothetical protein n=1 Tax=Branchiibius sp. NY16-3462-2 TaxID=1807500 RepID=UPI000796BDB8|nr:hypothetical protein [Branchiibius sp. NY16-3462-2]KYH45063.1 hypothetical protein AZH51_14345 [Branchiibius sp. NY16-3462-2]
MTRHVTRSTLSVAVAGLALSLAACSSTTTVTATGSGTAGRSTTTSASPSPTASTTSSTTSSSAATPTVEGAVQQMNAGFAKTKTAHVVAESVDGSETIKIELAGTIDGKNQQGMLSNNSAAEGGTVQFVVVGGKQYLKGDADYYKHSGNSNGAKYAGKWVIAPASASAGFSQLTLKSLFDEMESNFDAAKTGKMKLTNVTENGAPAWQIADSSTTGVIAADGSGHLLRAEHKEAGKTEKYVFDQYNAVPPVTAPAGAIQG